MRSRRMPALLTSTSRRPKALDGGLDQLASTVPVGDVVGRRDGLATRGTDLGGGLLGHLAEVVHHDLGALGGEEPRVLAPEPSARARDDRDPTLE